MLASSKSSARRHQTTLSAAPSPTTPHVMLGMSPTMQRDLQILRVYDSPTDNIYKSVLIQKTSTVEDVLEMIARKQTVSTRKQCRLLHWEHGTVRNMGSDEKPYKLVERLNKKGAEHMRVLLHEDAPDLDDGVIITLPKDTYIPGELLKGVVKYKSRKGRSAKEIFVTISGFERLVPQSEKSDGATVKVKKLFEVKKSIYTSKTATAKHTNTARNKDGNYSISADFAFTLRSDIPASCYLQNVQVRVQYQVTAYVDFWLGKTPETAIKFTIGRCCSLIDLHIKPASHTTLRWGDPLTLKLVSKTEEERLQTKTCCCQLTASLSKDPVGIGEPFDICISLKNQLHQKLLFFLIEVVQFVTVHPSSDAKHATVFKHVLHKEKVEDLPSLALKAPSDSQRFSLPIVLAAAMVDGHCSVTASLFSVSYHLSLVAVFDAPPEANPFVQTDLPFTVHASPINAIELHPQFRRDMSQVAAAEFWASSSSKGTDFLLYLSPIVGKYFVSYRDREGEATHAVIGSDWRGGFYFEDAPEQISSLAYLLLSLRDSFVSHAKPPRPVSGQVFNGGRSPASKRDPNILLSGSRGPPVPMRFSTMSLLDLEQLLIGHEEKMLAEIAAAAESRDSEVDKVLKELMRREIAEVESRFVLGRQKIQRLIVTLERDRKNSAGSSPRTTAAAASFAAGGLHTAVAAAAELSGSGGTTTPPPLGVAGSPRTRAFAHPLLQKQWDHNAPR